MLGGPIMAVGADALLSGETDGMASDFTRSDGTGYVSVLDTATPANDVSNVIADEWWTNSGTSPKLINTSAGALAWSPHNMVLQSQTFGTTWTQTRVTIGSDSTTAPDGTTTADTLIEDATAASTHQVSQSVTLIGGALYNFSAYAKKANRTWAVLHCGSGGTARAFFDLDNGVVGALTGTDAVSRQITDVGNGWYLCELVVLNDASAARAFEIRIGEADTDSTFSGLSQDSIYVWGAQINRGIVPTARLATTTAARYGLGIDYSGGSYGLLVEPAATNLQLRSNDINNAYYTKTDSTITSAALSLGAVSLDLVTEGTAGTAKVFTASANPVTLSASTTYTASCILKRGNTDWVRIIIQDSGVTNGVRLWVNLNTGAVGTLNAISVWTATSSAIVDLGNGYYRVSLVFSPGTDTTALFGIDTASADASATRVNNGTYYIGSIQIELGTVATSHVPTFAATVTRSADSITAASTTFNLGTSYSVYHRSTILALGSGSLAVIAAVDNGTANERAVDYSEGGKWKYVVTDGGATQALQDTALTAPTLGTAFKAGWRAAANSFNHAIDGVVDTVDAAGTMPTATTIRLGYTAISAGAQGPVRTHYVVHLPRAMTDLELDAATT
jgi:hypothetical protein